MSEKNQNDNLSVEKPSKTMSINVPYTPTSEEEVKASDFNQIDINEHHSDSDDDSDAEKVAVEDVVVKEEAPLAPEDITESEESEDEKEGEVVEDQLMSIRETNEEDVIDNIDSYKKEVEKKPESLSKGKKKRKKIPKFKDTILKRFKLWCVVGETLKCCSALLCCTFCELFGVFICPIFCSGVFLVVFVISTVLSVILLLVATVLFGVAYGILGLVSFCILNHVLLPLLLLLFVPNLLVLTVMMLSPFLLVFGVLCIPCSFVLGLFPFCILNPAPIVFCTKDD